MSKSSTNSNNSIEGNSNPRFRRCCFTLNNWTSDELTQITDSFKSWRYIIGKEIGEKGTPHLQGYVDFGGQVYFKTLQVIAPRAHWERAKGSERQNIIYCSKDDDYIIHGFTIQISRKSRLMKKYDAVIWKDWQSDILDIINNDPNDRTINWIVDEKGANGKSFLTKYLYLKYDAIVANGKKDNVYNQINNWLILHPDEDPRLIVLDIPRHNLEYINYGLLESIKNGLFYSGKYEGGICAFNSPHVFVFANVHPSMDKFTPDRWNIIDVSEKKEIPENDEIDEILKSSGIL